jgi:hypothetical protein
VIVDRKVFVHPADSIEWTLWVHQLLVCYMSRDSSVGIWTGFGLDDQMIGIRFPARVGIFLLDTTSRTALGPTQPLIQWEPGAVSLGVKRPGHEPDHSPPFSAEVKECVEIYLHYPNTSSWCGA